MTGVTRFYDQHPITEQQIRAAVARGGPADRRLRPDDFYPYDQDHYGGLAAVDRLAAAVKIGADTRVLDVCCGLGGPARYLAQKFGAAVTGVDLTLSRALGAHRLTRDCGLGGRVRVVNADATRLPFAAGAFDVAIGQEAFLHIDDKSALFSGLFRVLRPGGRLAFSDWLGFAGLDAAARVRLADGIAARAIHDPDTYFGFIATAGFADVRLVDLSAEWRQVLVERLEMFRTMAPDTVRQHGADAHARYISAYEFFVARITAGDLGGGLFTAVKPRS